MQPLAGRSRFLHRRVSAVSAAIARIGGTRHPSARPNAAPAATSDAWWRRTYTRVAATRGRERVPARAAAEQRRRAERRGRVARRERARDRPAQAVVELDVGVLGGAEPPEQRLHRAVREQRLGAHRDREPGRELDVAAARERGRGAARVPQQAVIGRARQPVRRPRRRAGLRTRSTARSTAASKRAISARIEAAPVLRR